MIVKELVRDTDNQFLVWEKVDYDEENDIPTLNLCRFFSCLEEAREYANTHDNLKNKEVWITGTFSSKEFLSGEEVIFDPPWSKK